MAFADTLRDLRKQHGLTQKELAETVSERLGSPIYRPTVTRWESGAHEPPACTLKKLAEIFDVTVDFLLGVEHKNDAEDLVRLLQNRPLLKKYVALLLTESDEKIKARCMLEGIDINN